MSSYIFPSKEHDGILIDAYASDLVKSFQRITQSSPSKDQHLQTAKPIVERMLEATGHHLDTPEGEIALAAFWLHANKADFTAEYGGRHDYEPLIGTLDIAMREAKGFNLDTAEGIEHFRQALVHANVGFGEYQSVMQQQNDPFNPSLMKQLTMELSQIAFNKHPDIGQTFHNFHVAREVAPSLLKELAHPNRIAPLQGNEIRHWLDLLDVNMSFMNSRGVSHSTIAYGEDVIMDLYRNITFQAMSDLVGQVNEVTIPLPRLYGSADNPVPIKRYDPIQSYFDENYRTNTDIPSPTLEDAAKVQIIFNTLHDFFTNAPNNTKLITLDGKELDRNDPQFLNLRRTIASVRDLHENMMGNAISPRLSPLMNYEQALEHWNARHAPIVPLYIVFENHALESKLSSDIHQTILNLRHEPGVVMFTDRDQAHNYFFHVNDNFHTSPRMIDPMCSLTDLQKVPVAKFWQLEVIKRGIVNMGESTHFFSGSQRFNLVKEMASQNGLHLPEGLLDAMRPMLNQGVHMENWARTVSDSISKVPANERARIQEELSVNAPIHVEPDAPSNQEDNPLPLSRPRLSPM